MDRISIGNKLLDHGFSAADLGFEYLIEAIKIYERGMPMGNVYARVADKFKADSCNIERCIRHSKIKATAFRDLENRELIARIKWNLEAWDAANEAAES